MARQKYTRTKVKGPNKLVTLLLFSVIGMFAYYQWDRVTAIVNELTGLYGGSQEGLMDAEFRRVAAIGKTSVARYWVLKGSPPSDNLAAGLEPPESYKHGSLLRMEVFQGTIVFTFDGGSGVNNGQIKYIPDTSQILQNVIKWNCETPSYSNLKDCTYRPPA